MPNIVRIFSTLRIQTEKWEYERNQKKYLKIKKMYNTEIKSPRINLTTDQVQLKIALENQKTSENKVSVLKVKNITTLQKALTCNQNWSKKRAIEIEAVV